MTTMGAVVGWGSVDAPQTSDFSNPKRAKKVQEREQAQRKSQEEEGGEGCVMV